MSARKGRALSQVELAFFTSPVRDETAPGMPMPTLQDPPASASSRATRSATARSVAR